MTRDFSFEKGWLHQADVQCTSCKGAGRLSAGGEPSTAGEYLCAVCSGAGRVRRGCGGAAEVGPYGYCLAEQLSFRREEFTKSP